RRRPERTRARRTGPRGRRASSAGRSSAASSQRYFAGDAESEQEAVAVAVEAEGRGEAERRPARQAPGHERRKVVGSVAEAERVRVAEAPVHLDAAGEVLRAERAAPGRGRERERPRRRHRVAELPGALREV